LARWSFSGFQPAGSQLAGSQLHAGSHDWLPTPRPRQTHAGPQHLTGSLSARSSTPALGFGGFRIYCCLACIAARMIPAEASGYTSQLPAPRQIPSWLAIPCQLAVPCAGAVRSPAAPAVSRLHAGLQFHADSQLYTLSTMLVGGTTLVSSSTLARRSLPARWLAATRMAVVCWLTAPRRLTALRSLSDLCRPTLSRGSILAGNPGLQLDAGLYLHAGSHAGLATPRSLQPHAGSLQPVCSSTPVRSSMLAHKGF